jgi:hypothetical protein
LPYSEITRKCLLDKYICWRKGKVLGTEGGKALGRELCYEQRKKKVNIDLYYVRRNIDILVLILEAIY